MHNNLTQTIEKIKTVLTSPDVLTFYFASQDGKKFCAVYADGIVDKRTFAESVVAPLKTIKKDDELQLICQTLAFPEVKTVQDIPTAIDEINEGNVALVVDGESQIIVVGLKFPPVRAVMEPPTQVAVKGPREGFIEDVKVNIALVRKRLKTEKLQIENVKSGKNSNTNVSIVYLKGVCDESLPQKVKEQIERHEIDFIPDSNYVASFISKKPRSLFKRCSTSEKPDVFCAKLSEGRVGILVDGSPLALTVPYMIMEDFQSVEDYYTTGYRATIIRLLRLISIIAGVFLPAVYVCAQLFKIQLIPVKLLLKIASSVSGISLSPSIEMFLTLFMLEVLNEASIRMPKYVGLALSVVGALVLGDTAVKAGIISTPAIIIIAFSAICLYTVPDLVETTTTLRWLYLIVAGSVGTFGITLLTGILICYLTSENSYGVPLLAPFSPLVLGDMKDGVYKVELPDLKRRPNVLRLKNKTRYKTKGGF